MWRSLLILLFAVALALPGATTAQASWRPPAAQRWVQPGFDDLSGTYTTNQGTAFVQRRGNAYVFTNPRGDQAVFVFVGPRRLAQVEGFWDPSVVATVRQDHLGRTVIRFDSPNAPSGFWVRSF